MKEASALEGLRMNSKKYLKKGCGFGSDQDKDDALVSMILPK